MAEQDNVIQFPERCNIREHLEEFVKDAEARNIRSVAVVWVDRDGGWGTGFLVESRDYVRVLDGMDEIVENITPEDDEEE